MACLHTATYSTCYRVTQAVGRAVSRDKDWLLTLQLQHEYDKVHGQLRIAIQERDVACEKFLMEQIRINEMDKIVK